MSTQLILYISITYISRAHLVVNRFLIITDALILAHKTKYESFEIQAEGCTVMQGKIRVVKRRLKVSIGTEG